MQQLRGMSFFKCLAFGAILTTISRILTRFLIRPQSSPSLVGVLPSFSSVRRLWLGDGHGEVENVTMFSSGRTSDMTTRRRDDERLTTSAYHCFYNGDRRALVCCPIEQGFRNIQRIRLSRQMLATCRQVGRQIRRKSRECHRASPSNHLL